MGKTFDEKLALTEERIRQLENQKKQLLQKKKGRGTQGTDASADRAWRDAGELDGRNRELHQ
jgi:restriction endonuclease S subunit